MLAFLNTVAARIRGFFRPRNLELDFDAEIAAHLDMAERDGLRRGLSLDEARRAARAELGGVTQLRESSRAAWGLPWLNGFALDARLGLRMLRRSWGLTLAGGLAMTIVITTGAVVFVFLDEFMGRTAPPLDEGDRIVAVQNWDAHAHRRVDTSRPDLERWGATLRTLEDLGGFQTIDRRLIVPGRAAEWVSVAEISASGFTLARVPPFLGRWIAERDERAGAPAVVIIGYDVWQSRFASDRGVIGQTLQLGEITRTVIGVMPEGFAFPVNHHYWIPLSADHLGSLKAAPGGAVFARLAPGVSLGGAQAELATVGLLPPATGPERGSGVDARRPRVVPYTFAFTDDVEMGELVWQQRIILLLVGLLLVPPCLNIAILIYGRTVTRQEEFAARFALGASRSRIVVQLCVEVLVLSSAAGAAAVVLTRPILAQIGEIISRFPELNGSLPFWVDFKFSWRAAIFVAGLSVAAALVAGLWPALRATGRVLPNALRSLGSRTRIPLGATWTALIVAQVGLALAALPSTIELAWGHLRPAVLGPGFAAREFLTAPFSANAGLQAEVARRIESDFGTPATFAAALPGAEPAVLIEIEATAPGITVRRYVRANQVDRAFFQVLDMPTLAGRTFDSGDFGGLATTIVDQAFVRQVFDGANAIGRRIRPVPAAGSESSRWYEIVGIVPDRPANTSQGRMYVPAAPGARDAESSTQLVVHAAYGQAQQSRRLQEIVASVDSSLRLGNLRRLDEVYRESQIASNLTSYVLAIVTFSVLVLSATGLYALMSFTVAQRRREIGIRAALGARPGRLLAGVFARALWQISSGVLVGAAVAFVLHRWMNIEVEGGWHVPGILPAAAMLVVIIGLMSAAGPARRAVRVDPTEALRDG